jgi:putative transposase
VADRIIGLYALGNSTREISDWMEENLGNRVSADTISSITDRVLPELQSWRTRPLDPVYPIVWMDDKNCPATRGIQDILIASTDNLNGFSDAINSVFPETIVQSCIVHQIRNSVKYVASKYQKVFLKDMKLIYQAVNRETAEDGLDNLELNWGEQYPLVIKSWRDNWHKLSAYFQYTDSIRRLIFSIVIKSLHYKITMLFFCLIMSI